MISCRRTCKDAPETCSKVLRAMCSWRRLYIDSGLLPKTSGAHCWSPRNATDLNMSNRWNSRMCLILLVIIPTESEIELRSSRTFIWVPWMLTELSSRLAVTEFRNCASEVKRRVKGTLSSSVTLGGMVVWCGKPKRTQRWSSSAAWKWFRL
jgi:hypothetical protein